MQEELERKSISVTVQAAKLTGRVMRAAVAAALRKIEKRAHYPKSRPEQYAPPYGADAGRT